MKKECLERFCTQMGLWVFKALVCLECRRERKSGNHKGSDYAGPLGYITNLGLDSKSKDKLGKTFTQEYDTIKLHFLKEKKKVTLVQFGEWIPGGPRLL